MHRLATVGIAITAELPAAAAMAHRRKNGRERDQPRERGGVGLTCHRREEKKSPSRGEVAVAIPCGRAVFAVLGDPRAEGACAGVEDGAAVAAVRAAASCAAISVLDERRGGGWVLSLYCYLCRALLRLLEPLPSLLERARAREKREARAGTVLPGKNPQLLLLLPCSALFCSLFNGCSWCLAVRQGCYHRFGVCHKVAVSLLVFILLWLELLRVGATGRVLLLPEPPPGLQLYGSVTSSYLR
ncbi:uncharacterized protein DS421_12g372040 [Arachis hypogaea]|nr:uncharacterized protein DS421_12g372040 [Arachis hypogaea]